MDPETKRHVSRALVLADGDREHAVLLLRGWCSQLSEVRDLLLTDAVDRFTRDHLMRMVRAVEAGRGA